MTYSLIRLVLAILPYSPRLATLWIHLWHRCRCSHHFSFYLMRSCLMALAILDYPTCKPTSSPSNRSSLKLFDWFWAYLVFTLPQSLPSRSSFIAACLALFAFKPFAPPNRVPAPTNSARERNHQSLPWHRVGYIRFSLPLPIFEIPSAALGVG